MEKIKEKMSQIKWDAEQKWYRAKDWCKNNREAVIIFGPILVKTTVDVIKILSRNGKIRDEKELKERWVYDRKNGHYYELKRKIRPQEWLIIDRRREMGEDLGTILAEMRLLK